MRGSAPGFIHVAITSVTGEEAPSQTVPCLLTRFEIHPQAILGTFETKMAARKAVRVGARCPWSFGKIRTVVSNTLISCMRQSTCRATLISPCTNLCILKHVVPKKRRIFRFLSIPQFNTIAPSNKFTSKIHQWARRCKVVQWISSPYPALGSHAKFGLVREHELLFLFNGITITRCYKVAESLRQYRPLDSKTSTRFPQY